MREDRDLWPASAKGAGDRAPPLGPDGGALVLLDGLHEVNDFVEAPLGLGGVRRPPVGMHAPPRAGP